MIVTDAIRQYFASRTGKRLLAVEARRWTSSDAFNATLAIARDEVIRRWAAAQYPEERERCWHAYKALETFPVFLQGLIDNDLIEKHRES